MVHFQVFPFHALAGKHALTELEEVCAEFALQSGLRVG